jgi:hypothetical protein
MYRTTYSTDFAAPPAPAQQQPSPAAAGEALSSLRRDPPIPSRYWMWVTEYRAQYQDPRVRRLRGSRLLKSLLHSQATAVAAGPARHTAEAARAPRRPEQRWSALNLYFAPDVPLGLIKASLEQQQKQHRGGT